LDKGQKKNWKKDKRNQTMIDDSPLWDAQAQAARDTGIEGDDSLRSSLSKQTNQKIWRR
jgi:hypothetical protein